MQIAAIRALDPIIDKYIGDRPRWLAYGWPAVESSGLTDVTNLVKAFVSGGGERSYFQLSPEESKALGVDIQRLVTDSDYSVWAGFALIEYYANTLVPQGVSYGTDTFWLLVKLSHGAGIGAIRSLLSRAKSAGIDINDWAALSTWARDNDRSLSAAIGKLSGYYGKWISNADRVYAVGTQIAALQDPAGTTVAAADDTLETLAENPLVPVAVAAGLAAIGYYLWTRR